MLWMFFMFTHILNSLFMLTAVNRCLAKGIGLPCSEGSVPVVGVKKTKM